MKLGMTNWNVLIVLACGPGVLIPCSLFERLVLSRSDIQTCYMIFVFSPKNVGYFPEFVLFSITLGALTLMFSV